MVPWSITVVLPQEGWETQLAAKAFGKSEIRSVELIAGGGWVPHVYPSTRLGVFSASKLSRGLVDREF
jgi:hypothetical protein